MMRYTSREYPDTILALGDCNEYISGAAALYVEQFSDCHHPGRCVIQKTERTLPNLPMSLADAVFQ